jgi:hypothetical protein
MSAIVLESLVANVAWQCLNRKGIGRKQDVAYFIILPEEDSGESTNIKKLQYLPNVR